VKVLNQTKDQIEKEMIDRRTMQEEILKQNSELGVEIEHERSIRDREESALKMSIATLRQEISVGREELVKNVASTKLTVQSLEARITEQSRDFRQCLDFEMGERLSADTRIEKQYVDIKMASDANHTNTETLARALDSALHSHSQALEAEKRDRNADMEEIKRDTDDRLMQLSNDLNDERENSTQDITSMRSMIQTLERNVSTKFQEAEDRFNVETAERKDRERQINKRFTELREAVLIAVRGKESS